MDRDKTHKKIDDLTTLIGVNNNRMYLHKERIPQLDLDLMRKNAIELYEAINQLHIQNLKDKREASLLESAESSNDHEVEVQEATADEEVVEAPEETVQREEPVAEKPVKSSEQVIEEKKESAGQKKSTSEKIERKSSKDDKVHLIEKLSKTKIASIRKSISISKRYELQNALFNNDPAAYNDAMDLLDGASDLKSARSIIEADLKKSHKWDDDEPLVEELINLVERKFA